jgi:hypothetical protein
LPAPAAILLRIRGWGNASATRSAGAAGAAAGRSAGAAILLRIRGWGNASATRSAGAARRRLVDRRARRDLVAHPWRGQRVGNKIRAGSPKSGRL